MRAWLLPAPGAFGEMALAEIPDPTPQSGQVLIRIRAAALGEADREVLLGSKRARHLRRQRFPLIPGSEFSGVVAALGANVHGRRVGDEVFGFLPAGPMQDQGTLAEFVAVDEREIFRKPIGVNFTDAAAAAGAGSVAVRALQLAGDVRPGRRVLLNGVSRAPAVLLMQMVRARDARVWVVGEEGEEALARRLGAEAVIQDDPERFASLTFRFQLIVDLEDRWSFGQVERMLRPGGTYLTPNFSWRYVSGSVSAMMSSRSCHLLRVTPDDAVYEELARNLASRKLRPVIQASYAMQDVPAAVDQLLSGPGTGSLVVVVSSY